MLLATCRALRSVGSEPTCVNTQAVRYATRLGEALGPKHNESNDGDDERLRSPNPKERSLRTLLVRKTRRSVQLESAVRFRHAKRDRFASPARLVCSGLS